MYIKIISVFAIITSNHLLFAKTIECDAVQGTALLIGADVFYYPVSKGSNCFSFEFKANQNESISSSKIIPIDINFVEIIDEFQILQNISGPIDSDSDLQNITEINAIHNYCNNVNGYEKIWSFWTDEWIKIGVENNSKPLIERYLLKKPKINYIELRNIMNFSCITVKSCHKCPAYFTSRHSPAAMNNNSENHAEVNG